MKQIKNYDQFNENFEVQTFNKGDKFRFRNIWFKGDTENCYEVEYSTVGGKVYYYLNGQLVSAPARALEKC